MFIDLLLSLCICFTITMLTVYIHELGHVFALYVTKRKLKLKSTTVHSIFTYGLYGKTFSPIYSDLVEGKDKDDIQKLIKFNAIMGLVFEFLFLFITLGFTMVYYFILKKDSYITLCTTIFIGLLTAILLLLLFFSPSDIRYIRKPDSFAYDDTLPSIKRKSYYIIIPLGLFALSSVLALVLPLLPR